MTKCKICIWTTPERDESGMAELRKHWSMHHPQQYHEIKLKLAEHDLTTRYCGSCGKSQLSAGYIDTCKKCKAWFCPECDHKVCGNVKANLIKAAA
jgi:hypothetical protein